MDSVFEPHQMNYSIVLYFKGIAGQFTYDIVKEEYDRIQNQYNELTYEIVSDSRPRFFAFETKNKVNVVVSIKDIQATYFLFDAGTILQETEENRSSVNIYLRDRAEAIAVDIDDPLVILDLFRSLESEVYTGVPFFPIEDIDGEDIFVNVREIVLIEFESGMLQEGEEEIEEKEEAPLDNLELSQEGFPDEILN